MAKKRSRTRRNSRDAPVAQKRSVMLCSEAAWNMLVTDGYKPVAKCPEVQMCINAYARSIAMMTIHLMQNTDQGDVRLKNALSRKVDISPAPHMGRTNLMYMLVREMMATGNALVYPESRDGRIEWLHPIPPGKYQMIDNADSYEVLLADGKRLKPDEVINLVYNPDPERPWHGLGVTVDVQEMVRCIRQANSTRTALMESPAPSVIIKVDGLTGDLAEPDGREAMAQKYITQTKNGLPWMIPAEAMSVETVKPLSITDLAIKDNLELDKKAVAAMLGVTPYTVGVGAYDGGEENAFIKTKLMFVAQIIEQELTAKLLLREDWFFRLNKRSLMAYSIADLSSVGAAMVDRMAMDRNEWRDWMDLPPDERMTEILGLENYLPADRLGDQKKLKGGGEDGTETGETDT